jgi:hypothetical protein
MKATMHCWRSMKWSRLANAQATLASRISTAACAPWLLSSSATEACCCCSCSWAWIVMLPSSWGAPDPYRRSLKRCQNVTAQRMTRMVKNVSPTPAPISRFLATFAGSSSAACMTAKELKGVVVVCAAGGRGKVFTELRKMDDYTMVSESPSEASSSYTLIDFGCC